jgi:hypothetical protein
MYEVIKYGNEAFILFLFPLIGLLLESKLSRSTASWTIVISTILLIPIFTPYTYIIPFAYRTLILIAASAAIVIFLKKLESPRMKVTYAVSFAGILFVILGFFSFLDSFSGYQRVERSWRSSKYKIEYITDQGFAGGPRLTYELSKYAFIPLFIRHIDTTVDRDTVNPCLLYFTESKLLFNKCDVTIKEIADAQ